MPATQPTNESPLTVRTIPFEFPSDLKAHWNSNKPEWSQMVNGASLVMPYLEPYLIRSVRAGLSEIDDPRLQAEARD
jgi:predicted metal-dependent hydrolase